MLPLLYLLLSLPAGAQTSSDALLLLEQVATAARTTPQWHIEGTLISTGAAATTPSTSHFQLLQQNPGTLRFEHQGPSHPALIVCDGAFAWHYSPPLNRYSKTPASSSPLCTPILGDWQRLPSILKDPTLAGTCDRDPAAQSPGFLLLTGHREPALPSSGRITQTLCIDTARQRIVWERWQNKYSTRLYRYSFSDPAFSPGSFQFQVPPGASLTTHELPSPRLMGERDLSLSPSITPPRIISQQPPKYPASAREQKIEGTVVLYLVIGASGKPEEVLLYRSLHPDLDKEAIRTTKNLRFTPALQNGQPIPISQFFEVNFQLL